ncbi:MAG: alkaline phosphatase family protein [Chloroflexi bacterium]|nr:alkaline phosphatase family protein [Chloroflexota bacterium]
MTTVLIMTDGMRPDALPLVNTPHLDGLQGRAAYTMAGASVMPSVTLPCHTSIFHSVPPQRHGIVTNIWQPMARPLPGLVDQARTAGRRCHFYHNWEPLRDLNRPEALDFSYYRNNCYTHDGDLVIAQAAAETIAAERPDFAFVYLGTIDVAGHVYGWMSDEYLRQIETVDGAVGSVLAALTPEDTVLLHSDHGGHDRTHGTDLPEDMTIPWMIAGPGIRQGYAIQSPISLLDSAPTLARVLGVAAHPHWEGRCIDEAFLA